MRLLPIILNIRLLKIMILRLRITCVFQAILIACIALTAPCIAEDKIKLETITIKGNKELPKILYVVPWQEAERTKQKKQKLKLHHFFGELYEPISVEAPKTQFD